MRKIYAVGKYVHKISLFKLFYQTNTIFKFSEDFYPKINEFVKESFAFNNIWREER